MNNKYKLQLLLFLFYNKKDMSGLVWSGLVWSGLGPVWVRSGSGLGQVWVRSGSSLGPVWVRSGPVVSSRPVLSGPGCSGQVCFGQTICYQLYDVIWKGTLL